jgi:SAM-dependent methyltransferase
MTGYALKLSEAEIARYRGMAEMAIAAESEEMAQAGIVPGAVVADVGCGPGAMSVELARMVGPTGSVLAVDQDPEALEAARSLVAGAGVDNVVLRQGQATATGLEPGSVDVVMMRHVLAHNGRDEQRIVDHLATLVRPGGCVYLLDIDGTAMRIVPAELLGQLSDMTERYLQFHLARGNDGAVGLRLADLLSAAGLTVLAHIGRYQIMRFMTGMRPPAWAARDQMLAEGVVTQQDVDRWAAAFEVLDAQPEKPTMFFPYFIGIGRRPE